MSCNSSTPVAITGMGCRFAGDATSPQKLWDLIGKGRSAWSKIPASRFNVGGVYHPNGERLGSTSVFGGVMYRDYTDSLSRDPETLPRYFITGNAGTMVSNHMAIVIGANLLLNSDVFVSMSNLGFLSPDGISYAFDARAAGYGRGEGVAALVLKALPAALRGQDPIRAVIRETALNQDGRTSTITAPSDKAQERLIRECYRKAGLDMSQTSYIEAHGTGTATGDPLEVSAISAAFDGQALQMGSIKANIGHTEAASGIAAIIKVALSLEKGLVPPNARFLQPDSTLKLNERNIKDEQACLSMISNLGDYVSDYRGTDEQGFLDNLAYTLGSRRSILPWTASCAAESLSDLVSALKSGRLTPKKTGEKIRLGWVFTGQGAQWNAMGRELVEAFLVFKEAILSCDEYIKEMGSTWTIMEELHRDEATTRVNNAEYSLPLSTAIQIALVQLLWSWGIRPTAITSHSSGEAAAAYAAGAISARSAIGITYFRGMLTVRPKPELAVPGGMIAVGLGRCEADAYVSRANKEYGACQGVVVACINSQSSTTCSGDVPAIEILEQLLKADGVFYRRLTVTEAFHSKHMEPMAEAFGDLLADLLKFDHDDKNNTDEDTQRKVLYSSPKIGGYMQSLKPLLGPTHWKESMVQPVEFESALRAMCSDSKTNEQTVDAIIEIGPHGALGGPIKQTTKGSKVAYLSCLSRGKSALDTMFQLATELTQKGYRPDMNAINFPNGRDEAKVRVLYDMPSYPWNHEKRYWREPRSSQETRQRRVPPHHLIGSRQPLCAPFAPMWRNVLRESDVPWIRDYVIGPSICFPAAGFISMAIEAVTQFCQATPDSSVVYRLRDVEFPRDLALPAEAEVDVDLRLTLRPCDSKSLGTRDWLEFHVHSLSGEIDTWTEHCTGLIKLENEEKQESQKLPDDTTYARKTDPRDLWDSLHATGIRHGPLFQNITRIQSNSQDSLCTFHVADTASVMPYSFENQLVVHPTTIDSVIQAAYTTLPWTGTRLKDHWLPRRLKQAKISSSLRSVGAGHTLCAQAGLADQNSQSFSADLAVFEADAKGNVSSNSLIIEITGLAFQSSGSGLGHQGTQTENTLSGSGSWVWAPDINLADSSFLKSSLSTGAEPLAREKDLMMDLRRCTVHYIQEATQQLTAEEISRLDGHILKYYEWMKEQLSLACTKKLGPDSDNWLRDDTEQRVTLRARVVRDSVNGEMISRLGSHLPAMLRREIEPLGLMMEDQLLSRYYVDALKWNRSNAQASKLVKLCAHDNPRSRILEIGAGTGSCTQLIMDALGENMPIESYDFTDVSAGWFEAARERFAATQDVMTFRKLDIEADPGDQGFEDNSYDVIVACQVLHATKNMRRTLKNVHKLLKPGGRLILVETTQDQLDLCFFAGLLPGWWLSEEPERRWSPNLTLDLWQTVLASSGFNGVEFEVPDGDDDEFYMISTIMSTATVEPELPNQADSDEIVLVHAGSPPPSAWLGSLQANIADKTGSTLSIHPLGHVDVVGKTCILLEDLDKPLLGSMESQSFEEITSTLTNSNALLWVSRGATMTSEDPWRSLHLGMLRTLRKESNGKRYVSLDIDGSRDPWTSKTSYAICRVFGASLSANSLDKEFEYAERNGVIHTPRAFNLDHRSNIEATEVVLEPLLQSDRRLRMDVKDPGLLDSLYFRDDDGDGEGDELPEDWVEIEPRAFGVNLHDVMVAMGQLEANRFMGCECAGVITRLGRAAIDKGELKVGDRVCALLLGHYGTRTRTPYTNVVHIQDDMSFEEGASIPLAFSTAYISLLSTARLHKGERVLIHGGAGGVGQAAIMLSQFVEAEVFVTAGTRAKRDLVRDKFGIGEDHIFSSRDVSFVDGIKTRTSGTGVDVVLNSLAGPFLQAGFDCLAEFGRFVEIGKRDLEQNSRLDMLAFTRNLSFSSIDMIAWERGKREEISRALKHVMSLLETKDIRLIGPISTYPIPDIERAFRVMQSGQHVGKIVATVAEGDLVPVCGRTDSLRLQPNASYLVVGGLEGLGRRICEWLVDRGGRHLIILSGSADTEAERDPFLAGLEHRGCVVYLHACDVSDENQLAAVLQVCKEGGVPPIRGVIQAAMDDFHATTNLKVQGSWNLHKVATEVDFFIMLSSLVGVIGSPGQANYAAASTFQDALAQHRRALGKPAVAIDLGMVSSVDYGVESYRDNASRSQILGCKAIHEEDLLSVLDMACSVSCPAVIVTGINTSPGPHWEEDWIQEKRFAGLKYRKSRLTGSGQSLESSPDSLQAQLQCAASHDEAVAIVVKQMTQKLMRMFGLTDNDISSTGNSSLAGLGIDSLVSIELRSWIASQLKVDIATSELTDNRRTIVELADLVVKRRSHILVNGV
ncbi:Type I Iterative PKS [Diaporthe eres]